MTFCLNQCSGRGACRSGFCECRAGAYGADCSLPPRHRLHRHHHHHTAAAAHLRLRAAGRVQHLPPRAPPKPRRVRHPRVPARRRRRHRAQVEQHAVRRRGGGARGAPRVAAPHDRPRRRRLLLRAGVRRLLHLRVQPAAPRPLAVRRVPQGQGGRPRVAARDALARGGARARAAEPAVLEPLGRRRPPVAVHARRGRVLRAGGAGQRDAPRPLGPAAAAAERLVGVPPVARAAARAADVRRERCYDACKDLVLPSWRRPEDFASSPLRFAAAAARARRRPRRPGRRRASSTSTARSAARAAAGRRARLRRQPRQLLVRAAPAAVRAVRRARGRGRRRHRRALAVVRRRARVVDLLRRAPGLGVVGADGGRGAPRLHPRRAAGRRPHAVESVLEWEQYAVRVERSRCRASSRSCAPSATARSARGRRRSSACGAASPTRASSPPRARASRGGEKGAAVGGGAPDAVDTLLEVLHVRLLRREARAGGGGAAARPADGCRVCRPARSEPSVGG